MLTIDSREKSLLCELVKKKADSLRIKHETKWIEVGDYVYGDVCFEAKSAADFLGSVLSKRMWTQLDNMDRCYKDNILMIHGDLDEAILKAIENSKSTIPVKQRTMYFTNQFLGAIARVILDTDIKPIWVKSEKEAASIITAVGKIKPMDRDVIRPQVHKRLSTDDLRLDILTSIKGVSIKKAKSLIKSYGSIMEIGECSVSEISKLEGFGDTLSKRIITTLNSEEKVKI